jgi:ADP-ribose pyrophosphatase
VTGFRRLGEHELLAPGMLRVGEVQVAAPDGRTFARVVVHHPGAVAVLPVHDDGSVTLVRQYRAPLDAEMWEVPAGTRDVDGEAPAATAVRELAEEAGLEAGRVELLIAFHNSPGFCDEVVHVFRATALRPCATELHGIEEQHMIVERFSSAEVLAMVRDGRTTDAKTVIGITLSALG